MRKILFAGPHYFSSCIQVGAQHYAKVLSRNNWQVMYCSQYLSPFNLLLGKNRQDIQSRFRNHIHGGERINANLFSYVPFTIMPHHNFTVFDKKWFLYNNYKFTVPALGRVLKKKGFDDIDVLWLDGPSQIFWKNAVKYRKSVYRIYDAIDQFSNTGKNLLEAHADAIVSSDVVIVSSLALINDLTAIYKNVHFVHCPNGVDLANFLKTDYPVPGEYQNNRRKKALYVGAIDEWFDDELLAYAAEHSPGMDFFIIGPDRLGKMNSVKGANIYYLGPRPYRAIPDYIYHADFGIIPFKSTKLVRYVHPIKMYEFFSLGKQVVSTAWEELELAGLPCLMAGNRADFLELLNMDEVLSPERDCLIRFAKMNTWESRLRNILKLIQ